LERINKLISLPGYQRLLLQLEQQERVRIYCRHDLAHSLAVARVAYILYLERVGCRDKEQVKELIYAAALVHDLGRTQAGEDHAAAGARLARRLLPEAGFTPEEVEQIALAVACHRSASLGTALLAGLIQEADDLSRPCFNCNVRDSCYKLKQMPTRQGLVY